MKTQNTKLFIVSVLLSIGWHTNAQQSYFNVSNFNKELPGVIVTKTGEVSSLTIICEHPDFLKRPTSPLKTPEGEIDKSTLEAFSVDGRVWVYRQTPIGSYWVILKCQGAVEVYDYVNSDSEGKISNIITIASAITKGKTRLLQSELMLGYKKKMGELVQDNAALMSKLGTNGYGALQYLNVVNEYNEWFEKTNPGTTKYLPAELGLMVPGGGGGAGSQPKTLAGVKEQMQQNKEAQTAKTEAKLNDLFAGRTASVSPELKSAKDNTLVKKETFGAKIKRIKSDGNKVGVLINVLPARTVKQETGTVQLTAQLNVDGGYLDESLRQAGQQLVDELNQAYKTTDFELIDLNKIPYRDVKVLATQTRVDDWWATKYKVVFAYTIDPRLEPANAEINGKIKFTATLNLLQSLMVTEYIGGPTSTKQDILAQILNLGGFRTLPFAQDDEIKDPQQLYEKTLTKLDVSLLDKIKSERADGLAKVVKRLVP